MKKIKEGRGEEGGSGGPEETERSLGGKSEGTPTSITIAGLRMKTFLPIKTAWCLKTSWS